MRWLIGLLTSVAAIAITGCIFVFVFGAIYGGVAYGGYVAFKFLASLFGVPA